MTGLTALTLPPPALMTWVGAHSANYAIGRRGPAGRVYAEAIVLHIMEGTLPSCDAWFRNPASHVSAHFGVGLGGQVHGYVLTANTAFANGIIEPGYTARLIDENGGMNPNLWTLAIEHEGMSGQTLAPAQWQASTHLAAWLWQTEIEAGRATGLAVDRDHILMHRDITPGQRARCPGWPETYQQAYIAEVRRLLNPPDYRAALIEELRGELAAATDDGTRAALRADRATARLRDLGATP